MLGHGIDLAGSQLGERVRIMRLDGWPLVDENSLGRLLRGKHTRPSLLLVVRLSLSGNIGLGEVFELALVHIFGGLRANWHTLQFASEIDWLDYSDALRFELLVHFLGALVCQSDDVTIVLHVSIMQWNVALIIERAHEPLLRLSPLDVIRPQTSVIEILPLLLLIEAHLAGVLNRVIVLLLVELTIDTLLLLSLRFLIDVSNVIG